MQNLSRKPPNMLLHRRRRRSSRPCRLLFISVEEIPDPPQRHPNRLDALAIQQRRHDIRKAGRVHVDAKPDHGAPVEAVAVFLAVISYTVNFDDPADDAGCVAVGEMDVHVPGYAFGQEPDQEG